MAGQSIADHRLTQCAIVILVTVGIDEDVANLSVQGTQHMHNHGLAGEGQEPLVFPAHTRALPACQDDASDVITLGQGISVGRFVQGAHISVSQWVGTARKWHHTSTRRWCGVAHGENAKHR